MKTILSSGYSFTPNKLINFNDFYSSYIGEAISYTAIWGMLSIVLLCMIAFFGVNLRGELSRKKQLKNVSGIVITIIFLILNIAFISVTINTAQTNDYVAQDFHYAINDSNLIVKCLDTNDKRMANFKPVSYFSKSTTVNAPKYISDHKKYPYKLYAKHYSTKYYLGTVKHGKFKPANNYAGGVFYKYLQYIHQHHLENKFKHTIYFEQDGRYLDGDDVQWVLTNNHDIVLHLNDNTIVKQTDVINN